MFDDMQITSKGNEITIKLAATISCANPEKTVKQLEIAKAGALAASVSESSEFRAFVETFKTMAVIDDSWEDIREDFYNVFEGIFKETSGDFDGDTIDNGKYSKIKAVKTGLKHGNNNAYYKNDIDTKNIIDTDTQTVLENKHNIVDTIISLYKECENAKRRYKKYSQMLSILKDIRADEYISCDDRALIDVKIKVCEEKTDCLRTAYEKLMEAISEV